MNLGGGKYWGNAHELPRRILGMYSGFEALANLLNWMKL